jgi:hypothetical protein
MVSMILLLELTHTKSGQNNKGVLIYTTADQDEIIELLRKHGSKE